MDCEGAKRLECSERFGEIPRTRLCVIARKHHCVVIVSSMGALPAANGEF